MSDKLLIEIDLHNGETEDAVRALVYLANKLVEAPTREVLSPVSWNARSSSDYQVKWRFTEDELRLPLDLDFVYDLRDELEMLGANISETGKSAIHNLRRQLDTCLHDYPSLLMDAD